MAAGSAQPTSSTVSFRLADFDPDNSGHEIKKNGWLLQQSLRKKSALEIG